MGNNQRTGKYIHTRDVSNKDIFQVGRVSAGFGIEVNTSGFEATSFQNHQHSLYSLIDIDGELVGIPTILVITAVGIDRAKQSGIGSHLQFMLEGMVGQSRMVHLNVDGKVFIQTPLTQEANYRGCIKIILMLSRLCRDRKSTRLNSSHVRTSY